MKKTPYITWLIFLAVLWAWMLKVIFIDGRGVLVLICTVVVLGAPTIRVVRGFLIALSNEKDEKRQQEEYENRIESETVSANTVDQNSCFCTNCGSKNEKTAKFCVGCGKPIS